MTDEVNKQREFLARCKKSVTYFIQTCLKLQHPSLGVIDFKLFSYQQRCLADFRKHRFNVFLKCRQSGISTLSGAYALWFAMFHSNKKILIVSKRDLDAKDFLSKNVQFAYDHLPEWMKRMWETPIRNEHELGFSNQSLIRSLTASKETLRSNASSLNIIDESAFIADMGDMWAGGWSCANVLSKVFIDGKMTTIGSLGDLDGPKWQDIDHQVQSDDGQQKSDKFYLNGEADTYKVKTSLGYTIECTGSHRLKNHNYEWIYADNLKIGQKLALKAGYAAGPYFETKLTDRRVISPQVMIEAKNADTINPLCEGCGDTISINYRTYKRNIQRNGRFICQGCATINNFSPDFNRPSIITTELAEMIGYYIGDGSISLDRPKRLRLCYDPQDQDLYAHFAKYAESLGLAHHKEDANGADEFRIDNAQFIEWLKLNKLNSKTHAGDAVIPEIILQSHQSIRIAFLRGLFEADGWYYRCDHSHRPNRGQYHLGLSSISEALIDQIQLALLDLGIIFKKSQSEGGYENSGKSWRLEATNLDNMVRFQDIIGFISVRKNIKIIKQTEQEPTKFSIDENGIFYDEIVAIEKGRCLTVDISVPVNNTYICNGFVSHNTLQHGGNVIVISTPNGVGNWYWGTWTEAIDGLNDFNPIRIRWYDMDWALEYLDPIRKVQVRIAPTDGIRPCKTKEEIERYGDFWSPWLESEYRGLQRKGESHKFRQEVLAEFIGSGGTILSATALKNIERMVNIFGPGHKVVSEPVIYINPATGEEEHLDLKGEESNEGLWIWNEPVHPVAPIMKGSRVVIPGKSGHTYVCGVDIATGKNGDYSTIEVFDVDTMEQVAEYMARVKTNVFCKIVDYIGRWYNNALACIDATGVGSDVVEDLRELLYPNLWRRTKLLPNGQIQAGNYGLAITDASKPTLNKTLTEFISEIEGEGYTIKSTRLWKQFQIYIRKRNSRGFDTGKTGAQDGRGNFDDLVCAAGLAFIAVGDSANIDPKALLPMRANRLDGPDLNVTDRARQQESVLQTFMAQRNDQNILLPYTQLASRDKSMSIDQELNRYTMQLSNPVISKEELKANIPIISTKKRPILPH